MSEIETDYSSLLEIVRDMYEEKIPFNKVLGMTLASLSSEGVRVEFKMREDLVGNYYHGTLHGGVISAVLDATGGITATLSVVKRMSGKPIEDIAESLSRVGTIDLRVDYLRPGRGKMFKAQSSIMRTGNKVAVTRMELLNDEDLLVAVGTGTYLVG